MTQIAVFVSGGGTNLQALIDKEKAKELGEGRLKLVISSNENAYAIERAKAAGIETLVLSKKAYSSQEALDEALLSALGSRDISLVVLAGYMQIISPAVTGAYKNRMINVHPSLIPSFCGEGFYGLHVHRAALASGVKVTGATVHFVSDVVDGGAIIAQRAVCVLEGDTPETLQQRVMEEAEWKILGEAVRLFCAGKIRVEGSRAFID